MTPGISTHVFLPHRLHPGLLDALAASGARTIELFAARHHFDYTDRASVREIASWFRSNQVTPTLHQPLSAEPRWTRHTEPSLHLIANEKSHRIAAMDEVKRALEAAEQIPIASCVLHLGQKHEAWSDRALEHSLTAIEHLQAFAGPLGVRLLLENLENEITTPDHLLAILRIGHFDRVGVCLDLGHAYLSELGLEATFSLLKPRIMECHLHDNHGPHAPRPSNGSLDEHLWPARSAQRIEGGIDWAKTYPLLATLHPETAGVLEIQYDLDESPAAVTRAAIEAFDQQRRLLELQS
ncbi:sugar phosphate isomerase/epimerase [Granulicella sp. WH15]|uniref:sugar phosphate isomerase/epimerase family protein n=1 Tax=Granulicella sp. WH15 TaxID=2602070 RepID=UPI001366A735|nr:sugar phosphate isomerase/epimerase family protein [Granulicella sp. WH15]QHN02294.1 sugar phosphate isomerase/epimerase [Granulicella sp. WH15]